MKEKRKGPIGRAAGLAEGVAATVRRMQREREPRLLVYDETGYARLVQPNGRGYERLLDTAERMVALVDEAEAEAKPRGTGRADDAGPRRAARTKGGEDAKPRGAGAADAKPRRAARTKDAANAKPRATRRNKDAGSAKPRGTGRAAGGRRARSTGSAGEMKKPRPSAPGGDS
jgi:hypothetical protein